MTFVLLGIPDGSNGMNHVFRMKIACSSDNGVADWATSNLAALFDDAFPTLRVNRPISSISSIQSPMGGRGHSLRILIGDIAKRNVHGNTVLRVAGGLIAGTGTFFLIGA